MLNLHLTENVPSTVLVFQRKRSNLEKILETCYILESFFRMWKCWVAGTNLKIFLIISPAFRNSIIYRACRLVAPSSPHLVKNTVCSKETPDYLDNFNSL